MDKGADSPPKALVHLIYGSAVLGAAAPALVVAWTLIMLLPRVTQRWAVAHCTVRLFAKAVGIRLVGKPIAKAEQPVIYVANHGSFLDAVVLVACFAHRVCFVAASEFSNKPFLGPLLRRLDMDFVHRDEPSKAAGDMRRLVRHLRSDDCLVLFPEGSLAPMKGLRDFQMGAFYIAAKAAVPVVPIGIRDASTVLKPHTYLPHHGTIEVKTGSAITPTGTGRRDLQSLMSATRNAISELSGEDDVSQL